MGYLAVHISASQTMIMLQHFNIESKGELEGPRRDAIALLTKLSLIAHISYRQGTHRSTQHRPPHLLQIPAAIPLASSSPVSHDDDEPIWSRPSSWRR